MYRLKKTFRFEAAHYLPHHQGKCARLHGHSWVLHIYVEGRVLHDQGSSSGMLVDFDHLKMVVQPLIEQRLDHHCLNDTLPLPNPTSEAIATWVFHQLFQRFSELPKRNPWRLVAVEVEETCTSSCYYTGD